MQQIRGCTLGNGGHAAFASIMWSPPLNSRRSHDEVEEGDVDGDGANGDRKKGGGDFQDCLARVSCDVLLVFGKDDPWCKPAYAKKMLKALEERGKNAAIVTSAAPVVPVPIQRYIEITNAGHCPNHEAPKTVGHLVKAWVGAKDQDRRKEQLSLIEQQKHKIFTEEWGEHAATELDKEDIELGLVDRIVSSFM